MCCLNVRFLSNVIPRNLPSSCIGIGVWSQRIGFGVIFLRFLSLDFGVNIISNVFESLIEILFFPQYFMMSLSAFWRLFWILWMLGDVEYILMSSANCERYVLMVLGIGMSDT